jgi:hypothetical protein
MAFQVKKAKREQIYVKIALMAPSGGGKTYGALRLATGMADELEKINGVRPKILMGNTEQKRGYYYANEFDYDIVDIEAPHNPEKYVEFVQFAVSEGYGIVILDSSSHEWEGKGGCLELHKQAGGTYQSWDKVTPRHNRFINTLADSPIHVIATMRGKDQYEMEKDSSGKTTVKKLGVGAKQRDGFEYEFTCTFLIDQKTSMSEVQKDNTHIFENEGAVLLSEEHGRKIIRWANSGEGYTPPKRIENTESKTETKSSFVLDTATLDEIKPILMEICKAKAKANRPIVDDILKDVKGRNVNNITDIEIAKDIYNQLINIKE